LEAATLPLFIRKMDKYIISGYCRIKENWIETSREGRQYNTQFADFSDFMKSLYLSGGIDYPKFYKMDNLCKIALISSEYLVKETGLRGKYDAESIGIIIENRSASIDSDSRHAESFKDKRNYFPSPAIFVYTLPNIAVGEICIRNGIKGENALFIFDEFDADFVFDYINILLKTKKVESCLGGWIEYSQNGYESFLFLVEEENKLEQKEKTIPFTKEELKKVYFKN
jgi:hypothetical protein